MILAQVFLPLSEGFASLEEEFAGERAVEHSVEFREMLAVVKGGDVKRHRYFFVESHILHAALRKGIFVCDD